MMSCEGRNVCRASPHSAQANGSISHARSQCTSVSAIAQAKVNGMHTAPSDAILMEIA